MTLFAKQIDSAVRRYVINGDVRGYGELNYPDSLPMVLDEVKNVVDSCYRISKLPDDAGYSRMAKLLGDILPYRVDTSNPIYTDTLITQKIRLIASELHGKIPVEEENEFLRLAATHLNMMDLLDVAQTNAELITDHASRVSEIAFNASCYIFLGKPGKGVSQYRAEIVSFKSVPKDKQPPESPEDNPLFGLRILGSEINQKIRQGYLTREDSNEIIGTVADLLEGVPEMIGGFPNRNVAEINSLIAVLQDARDSR